MAPPVSPPSPDRRWSPLLLPRTNVRPGGGGKEISGQKESICPPFGVAFGAGGVLPLPSWFPLPSREALRRQWLW